MPVIELDAAVHQIPGDDAGAAAVLDHEPEGEELLVDDHALGHPPLQLLVEHLDQDVPGDVGRVDRARRAGGAERALVEPALVVAREHAAPVLELVDVARRLGREDLDRVLVAEVVGALDGVEGVLLGAVLGLVPERRVDAALGGAGVAARRVQLRDHRDLRASIVSLDGCAHAGAPGADDEDVVGRLHHVGRYRIARVRGACKRRLARQAEVTANRREPAGCAGPIARSTRPKTGVEHLDLAHAATSVPPTNVAWSQFASLPVPPRPPPSPAGRAREPSRGTSPAPAALLRRRRARRSRARPDRTARAGRREWIDGIRSSERERRGEGPFLRRPLVRSRLSSP